MYGKYTLDMLPLDIGTFYIVDGINQWIRNWWRYQPLIKLDRVGWFTKGQVSEIYLWSPPLAALETDM